MLMRIYYCKTLKNNLAPELTDQEKIELKKRIRDTLSHINPPDENLYEYSVVPYTILASRASNGNVFVDDIS